MDRDEALKAGYRYYCQDCIELYRIAPVVVGGPILGGRPILCCDICGSDQIVRIEDDKEPETL